MQGYREKFLLPTGFGKTERPGEGVLGNVAREDNITTKSTQINPMVRSQ